MKSKPSVAIPRATDFNSVVAVDLKIVGNENISWMVCAFTIFIKGIVIKDKNLETNIRGIHEGLTKEGLSFKILHRLYTLMPHNCEGRIRSITFSSEFREIY